jgi:hypothetical protein
MYFFSLNTSLKMAEKYRRFTTRCISHQLTVQSVYSIWWLFLLHGGRIILKKVKFRNKKLNLNQSPPPRITSEFGALQYPVRLVICCSDSGVTFGGKPWETFVSLRSDTWLFGSTRNTGEFDTVQCNRGTDTTVRADWRCDCTGGTACRSTLKLGNQCIDVHLAAICLLATNTTFPPP